MLFVSALIGCSSDQLVNSNPADTPSLEVTSDSSYDATVSYDSLSDDSVKMDVPPTQGGFGYSCEHTADCDSGLCLQTENGKKCSASCSESCQSGYTCGQVVAQGSDIQFVCVSRMLNLCNPCTTNDQCNFTKDSNNACISFGDAGSFCGISCSAVSDDCPNGYTCKFITDAKTNKGSSQCVPAKNAMCTCSPHAIEKGFSTSCANTNPFGSCGGNRTCMVDGLSGCVGQVPQQETCNGKDDDCDGKTDNIDMNKNGVQCQNTNQFGTCIGKFIACSDGKPICDAPDAVPEVCNGKDDNCDGETDEKLCGDGNGCTTDVCNTDGSCKHTPLTGTMCDDADICTSLSQCAAGVCKSGNALNCDDNDPCSTDWCDPFKGCQHKPASDAVCKDDGIACTQDVCQDGKCMHPNWPDGKSCLEDGNVCTDDSCKAGECVHINNVKKCNDGNICTENDNCKDGTCSVSTPKNCNDGNGCTKDLCDSKSSVGCYSVPADATDAFCADDNNNCTIDKCKNSTCLHVPISGCK